MDLGTGDGRFVLAHAAAHPERLVLGVDANADAMREASRRAARSTSTRRNAQRAVRGRPAGAVAGGLEGLADLVTVHFPWGSLRSAAAGHDPELTARLARLVRPEAASSSCSPTPRGMAPPDRSGCRGRHLCAARTAAGGDPPATLDDAVAAHSSWGKRLLRHPAPGRTAWWIRLERPAVEMGGMARIDP